MHWFSRRFEVPHRLRAIVRARESSVIVLAVIAGAIAGLAVAAMGETVGYMHEFFSGSIPASAYRGEFHLIRSMRFSYRALAACCSAWLRPISRAGAAPRSIRSRPMRCMVAACRFAAA